MVDVFRDAVDIVADSYGSKPEIRLHKTDVD